MPPVTFVCTSCRHALSRQSARSYTRPPFAPKPTPNYKHLRQNPGLYEQNSNARNYPHTAQHAWRILALHEELAALRQTSQAARERRNTLTAQFKQGDRSRMAEAQTIKESLKLVEQTERKLTEEMEMLALEIPNLSSFSTPLGSEPTILEHINPHLLPPTTPRGTGKSHVDIGRTLDILDFEASSSTSGWGFYFLKNDGALLEQALIQYALQTARSRGGWTITTPPSLVYAHIASACGFMPRDSNGETQIYNIANTESAAAVVENNKSDGGSLVLAGTAEIPFAGSLADRVVSEEELPIKLIGPSRCYRAEAGARGVDTKGLYRVHEFTKVEMFAWTAAKADTAQGGRRFGDDGDDDDPAFAVFEEMVGLQKDILTSLGLHARVLEMPSTDLGASAQRKVDMEVFFPSRAKDDGYGEVTSVSMCGDYQSRRLNTRVKMLRHGGALGWAQTLNGTAMAVPRVLAAILENHWDEETQSVRVPEALRKWMPGDFITKPAR